jgi:hypothetical protein
MIMNTPEKTQNNDAAPQNLACKIAAVHGETPKRMRVTMIGSSAVHRFISRIEKARERNLLAPLSLD